MCNVGSKDYSKIEVSIYQVFVYSDFRSLYDYMPLDEAYPLVKDLNKVHSKENFYFVIEIK